MSNSIDQLMQEGGARAKTPRNEQSSIHNKTANLSPTSSRSESIRGESVSSSPSSMSSPKSANGSQHRFTNSGDGETSLRGTAKLSDRGSLSSRGGPGVNGAANFTDFFSAEVFHIVLHNPTTAHRFLKFCQTRSCAENLEFLQKVDEYYRLLDETQRLLSSIYGTYIASEAPHQINISSTDARRLSRDIKSATQSILPSLEDIFNPSQAHIEKLLATDMYPRFVKHQVTASATMALASDRDRFPGLGDCFCITDPKRADNPIVFASDGFVSVTGYSRADIIPRNCRFLQGSYTDSQATKRLRVSIENCEETVELLLNYRKNGDPFWNLLYVSPLLDASGEVRFFLGGQINCSTTIHSRTDVLRILSMNDDDTESVIESTQRTASVKSRESMKDVYVYPKSSFFKSFKKYKATPLLVKDEAGMENELIDKLGKLQFNKQVEAFYTAYSKYVVLQYTPHSQALTIKYYSPGIVDILCLNLPNGSVAPIHDKDIFKVLAEHSPTSISRGFKSVVREELRLGHAVSIETGLLTGYEEVKKQQGFFGAGKQEKERGLRRAEEKYVCHFTPLKDEVGRVEWVVLTVAPKVG
ncbi:hypothetical protein CJF30_00003944 [Rutstroemia sp. NJR-2017a BBW]|nr:hypothetical protein CJF30_00003944 [Rutstroemia sp. NJR-2017a BBW]